MSPRLRQYKILCQKQWTDTIGAGCCVVFMSSSTTDRPYPRLPLFDLVVYTGRQFVPTECSAGHTDILLLVARTLPSRWRRPYTVLSTQCEIPTSTVLLPLRQPLRSIFSFLLFCCKFSLVCWLAPFFLPACSCIAIRCMA